jgi:hypothetical protein
VTESYRIQHRVTSTTAISTATVMLFATTRKAAQLIADRQPTGNYKEVKV